MATTEERVATDPATGFLAYERPLRLWAGLILFAFVLTHLLNHAVGVFGVAWMEYFQTYRSGFWRSAGGTALLYTAAALHVGLALKRIVSRRTWRMPWMEAAQIALGLLVPVVLINHFVATRYLATHHGFDDSYHNELAQLWPGLFWKQTLLMLVVWFHGAIGINFAMSSKPWFPRVREIGMVLMCLIPILALAGFISAGREALEIGSPGARWSPEQIAAFRRAVRIGDLGLLGVAGLLLVIVLGRAVARRIGNKVTIRYLGHGEIRATPGLTLLEISRANQVPHPSHCGGRARCSTCRVLVISGLERLPEPGPLEQRLLRRISAPARVRLACQIWPQSDLSVQVLLPVGARPSSKTLEEESYKWGVDREVTIVFADIRGFTGLVRSQLPADLVVVLNRIIAEMSQAVEAHGGRVSMTLSDGILAVFGLGASRGAGAKAAMQASLDMLKSARALTTELGSALSQPIRVGIGVHTGHAVIGRVGDEERGYTLTALGETVSIASRLETATKELLADCLVSADTAAAAGLKLAMTKKHEVHARDRAEPLVVHALTEGMVLEETEKREQA